jgi:hypothetical protein
MTFSIDRAHGSWSGATVSEAPRKAAAGAKNGDFASSLTSASATISSPPPEVSAEVRAAAAAAANLVEEGRELHFDHDEDGRLRVTLKDTQGNALRTVPTAEVFDFAAGKVTD